MIDVLNLEWNSGASRDRESSTLVCNYLRMQGLNVVEGSIFQGKYLIFKLRPRVLFVSNSAGSGLNINVIKYAKQQGIKVVTGCAEGNFRADQLDMFFWGVNAEKILHEDFTMLWNDRSYRMVVDQYPELAGRLSVSGGVGFDRYLFNSRCDLTTKNGCGSLSLMKEKYSLTVLVSCWSFDFLYCDQVMSNIPNDNLVRKFFARDRAAFRDVLEKVIRDCDDVLFVLKEHPAVRMGEKASAIEGLDFYPNAIRVKNEISISELISDSDVVVSYESTTALEAWLKGKQTFLLNPSGTRFPCDREDYYKGQPHFSCSMSVSNALKSYIENGEIPQFEDYKNARENIISNVIGFSDGLNHVRFGNGIIELISMHSCELKLGLVGIVEAWKQKAKYILLQLMYKMNMRYSYLNKELIWSDDEVSDLSARRQVQQDEFYKENGLNLGHLAAIQCSKPS